MKKQNISILVPMYNEAAAIPEFFPAIHAVMAQTDVDYKIICVDDGSSDNTLRLLTDIAANDQHLQVVAFSRNFGKEAAMTAALDYADGDAAIPIDADLQDPPGLVHTFLEEWRNGYDVVYGRRTDRRGDSRAKIFTAKWFYRILNYLSDVEIPEDVGDFRLLSRRAVDALTSLVSRTSPPNRLNAQPNEILVRVLGSKNMFDTMAPCRTLVTRSLSA